MKNQLHPVLASAEARVFVVVFLLLAGGAVPVEGQMAADFLRSDFKARDVAIPFYNGPDHELSSVVRMARVYTVFQRRGFFRIGVLPTKVLEDVRVEIQEAGLVTNSLAGLHQWLEGRKSEVELRKVRFGMKTGGTNSLSAGQARLAPDGRLELSHGVTLILGKKELQAASGMLDITGERIGELVLETTPPQTNNFRLLAATPDPINPNPTQ